MIEAMRDTIFTKKQALPFVFDEDVSRVFEDMIQRSVPGYALTLQMIAVIARQYAQKNSKLYDLGCSLGASTLAMAHGIKVDDCVIVSVDNSEAMLASCKQHIVKAPVSIQLMLADITQVDIQDASVVVLNFTLQFVDIDKREALIRRIYAGMREGGVLVLSEKIMTHESFDQQQYTQLHESFKKMQGYSALEVSRKRESLENVLVPESIATHHQRLKQAGFTHSQTWFQCFNFASILAYKL